MTQLLTSKKAKVCSVYTTSSPPEDAMVAPRNWTISQCDPLLPEPPSSSSSSFGSVGQLDARRAAMSSRGLSINNRE